MNSIQARVENPENANDCQPLSPPSDEGIFEWLNLNMMQTAVQHINYPAVLGSPRSYFITIGCLLDFRVILPL